jgi:hypothetical protein
MDPEVYESTPPPPAPPVAPTRVLVVIDAPDEVQRWVDALTHFAQLGGPAWPDPPHATLPTGVVTLARLWEVVNREFFLGEDSWSVAEHGLPKLTLPDGSTFGSDIEADPAPEPNSGSTWHNALHACLGNFH